MIHSSPRPLPRRRLEQLVHGLGLRLGQGAERIAAEIDQLNLEIEQLQRQHEQALVELEQTRQRQWVDTANQWDESRQTCWDEAELRSYRAAADCRRREKSLREEAQRDELAVQQEATGRTTEIQRRYQQAADAAAHRLMQTRQQLAGLVRGALELQQAADAALAQHSLSIPEGEEAPPMRSPAEAAEAVRQIKLAIEATRGHVQRLQEMPASRFFSSIVWWLICGLIFVLTALSLVAAAKLSPVWAIPLSVGLTSALVLVSMLGVRPWLRRAAAAEYPKIRGQLAWARRQHDLGLQLAAAEQAAEIKRLTSKRDDRLAQVQGWQLAQLEEINRKLEAAIHGLRGKARHEQLQAAEQLETGLRQIDAQFDNRTREESHLADTRKADTVRQFNCQQQALRGRIESRRQAGSLRLSQAAGRALALVQRNRQWSAEHFPAWSFFDAQPMPWPPAVGEPRLPLGSLELGPLLSPPSEFPPAQWETPLLFSPLRDGYLVVHGDAAALGVRPWVRSLVLRALTTLPCGKTQLCIVDPQGLGSDFGWLMSLSDFDPALVTHRVWTQAAHIARQLQTLEATAEDFIQQSLRNQYEHIVQYNRDAGGLAEPFRLLLWAGFPAGLDEQSWKSLQSLLDSGARCGIIPILLIENEAALSGSQAEQLNRRGLHLNLQDHGQFQMARGPLKGVSLKREEPPGDALCDQIILEVGRRALAASRVEVPLGDLLASAVQHRWQADSSQLLEIPIGQSGIGRIQSLRLGQGTAQHAIIAGKTGSGKSSLLHALITSGALKYSPQRLRFVLLDFKKGVEFQVYSDCQLPHADIIGIESHREFGLSALEYVDSCLQRRGELFRGAGVQDIASWNAAHPEQPKPRMLLVIDEFQELFVEDDKLSQSASLILDRIVRQGRSFGVHAVLSSQTLAGAYSLPRTTLGQMAVRIALQCDPADAQIIFSDDNPAAARLKHPGQAVYNDAGGRIEGNQPMQIGWLDKPAQLRWLSAMTGGYRNDDDSTNRLGRTVVYDGNRPADWDAQRADLAVRQAEREINPAALWCVVGESVAISPAVVFPLTNQSGRNVLVVGGEDALAAAVLDTVTHSFVRACQLRGSPAALVTIQGAKPTDTQALLLPSRWQRLPCQTTTADDRTASQILQDVHRQLQERLANPADQGAPLLVNLIQLGRLRSLRREDEFSFSSTDASPDKLLEELLRDGPSQNIHLQIWVESFSTANRWLSRGALRELEIRLLMQMSANDSSNLVDSVAASRLGEHVMLLFDEATGRDQKFRPYSRQSIEQLVAWVTKANNSGRLDEN